METSPLPPDTPGDGANVLQVVVAVVYCRGRRPGIRRSRCLAAIMGGLNREERVVGTTVTKSMYTL